MFTCHIVDSRGFAFTSLVTVLLCCAAIPAVAQLDPVVTIRANPSESIYPVSFSPDGMKMAYGFGRRIEICDAKTGAQIRVFEEVPNVCDLDFSPDGELIAAGMDQYTAQVWDMHSGKRLHTFQHPEPPRHRGIVNYGRMYVAFSPDGRRLLTVDTEGGLSLWNLETGSRIRWYTTFGGSQSLSASLEFLPDSKRVFLSIGGAHMYLFDLETEQIIYNIGASEFSLSRDGKKMLASAGVTLYDVDTGEPIRSYGDLLPEGWAQPVALSPDGTMILIGAYRGHNRLILDSNTGEQLLSSPSTQDDTTIRFSPDGKRFLSVSGKYNEPKILRIYDISDLTSGVRGMESYDPKE